MTDQRPLSPHISIYRPQLTSVLSILHRGTGIVMSLCVLMLILWLSMLATGSERFDRVEELVGNPFVRVLLLGGLFSFFYHLCNGVRHLFWDTGRGLTIEQTYRSGWAVVFVALLATVGVFVYAMFGGAS